MSIAADAPGAIWFTDEVGNRLGRFLLANATFELFLLPTPGSAPQQLALDRAGTVWFTEFRAHKLGRYFPSNATFVEYPIPTPEAHPMGIAVDASGFVWFTEFRGNKVGRLDPGTGRIDEYPIPAPDARAHAVTVDRNGIVWFSQSSTGKIGRLDPGTGAIREFAGPRGAGATPIGIAVDADGNVWYADHNSMVGRFDPRTGAFTEFVASASLPYGIAVAPDGIIWFVSHGTGLGRLDPVTARVEVYSLPSTSTNAQWLAVDPAGHVWFGEPWTGRIGLLAARPDFSITTSVDRLALRGGEAADLTVIVISIGGFNSTVDLGIEGPARGLQLALGPVRVAPPPGGSAAARLRISVGGAPPGTQHLSLVGTLGTSSRSKAVAVTITSQAVFDIPVEGRIFQVGILSNTTIFDFQFSQPTKSVGFRISLPTGTRGFAEVAIPKELLHGNFTVVIGDLSREFRLRENATHSFVALTYDFRAGRVVISATMVIPEFPVAVAITLLASLTIAVTATRRANKIGVSSPHGRSCADAVSSP